MNSKAIFEVENVTTITGRGPFIFVKVLGCKDFRVESGLELHGCEIVGGDIPRALDNEGNQRLDFWGFQLKNDGDEANFSVGDIVELSQ